MDAELRNYLDGLREDLRSEISAVRADMATKDDLRREISGVRQAMATKDDLRREIAALDEKIDRFAVEMRHQFEVTAEGLRHQMQVMAEGIVMNAEALTRFRTEFIAEIHELRRGR